MRWTQGGNLCDYTKKHGLELTQGLGKAENRDDMGLLEAGLENRPRFESSSPPSTLQCLFSPGSWLELLGWF